MGRKSEYNPELGKRICERIATSSDSVHKICKDEGMPVVSTVMKWLNDFPEFSEQYARAKESQADFMAQEILDISDDGSKDNIIIDNDGKPYAIEHREWTSRSKLRVDARKWLMSKLAPKKYGDKLDLTTDGQQFAAPIINVHAKTE